MLILYRLLLLFLSIMLIYQPVFSEPNDIHPIDYNKIISDTWVGKKVLNSSEVVNIEDFILLKFEKIEINGANTLLSYLDARYKLKTNSPESPIVYFLFSTIFHDKQVPVSIFGSLVLPESYNDITEREAILDKNRNKAHSIMQEMLEVMKSGGNIEEFEKSFQN